MRHKRPLVLGAYGAAVSLIGTGAAPALLRWRAARGRELPKRLAERRGHPSCPRPAGALVSIHAASVGELVSMLPVVETLVARDFPTLVTTGTVTSAEVAATRLPAGAIHQFIPLDVPRYVRRFLDHWQPSLALLAESELWPVLIGQLAARRIPLVLANARMSERSYRRWSRARPLARALLGRVDLCLAQSPHDAERLAALGAPRVETAGNLKLDAPAPPASAATLVRMRRALLQRRIFVAASTHPGEEDVLVRVHARLCGDAPDLLTVIAPRHPDRGGAIAEIARSAGATVVQRTTVEIPDRDTGIYVADTIGELGLFYRLADIAFLGGSLVPHGGQNPIEPAKLGAPILHGPHVRNFTEVYAALDEAHGAIEVDGEDTLAQAVAGLSADADARDAMRLAATDVLGALGGALVRTIAAIDPYLMQIRLGSS